MTDKDLSKHQELAALIFTVALAAMIFSLGAIRYEVNDDMAITALVKGLFGLPAGAEGVFISPFLGSVLFVSYKFLPILPWFSLVLYTGLFLACFSAGLTILLAIRSVGGKVAGLLGVALFIGLTALQVNFSAVSLLLWITGCTFLLFSVRRSMPVNRYFWLAAAQLAAAYLLRPTLLPVMVLFALPLLLTLLLGGDRKLAGRALTPLMIVLLLSLFSSMAIRTGNSYPDYQEFNKIRSEFNDTYRGRPTPQTTQALYAAGWSYEDYLVASNWWLHDNTFFNTRQIKAFLDKNAPESSIFAIEAVKENLGTYKIYFLIIFSWGLVILSSIPFREVKRVRTIDLLLYLYLLATILLLMGIRFPQRVAYPSFFLLFLSALLIFDNVEDNDGSIFLKFVPPLLFIAFLAVTFVPVAGQRVREVQQLKGTKKYIDQTVQSVLQSNGADSIIVDLNPHVLPTNYLPFAENDPILKARIMPGGWLVGSPVYADFLRREGLGDRSTAVAAMINNRRIVFRFWDSRDLPYGGYVMNIFLRHLRQRYNPTDTGRQVNVKVINDFRQGKTGLIYFQLVTIP